MPAAPKCVTWWWAALAVAGWACGAPVQGSHAASGPQRATVTANELDLAQQVFVLVNNARSDAGLPALLANAQMADVAFQHSADMAARQYFSHTDPDGHTAADRCAAAGLDFRWLGENIAHGQTSPQQVMAEWMDSAGHRADILNVRAAESGVGVHDADPAGLYWTQLFRQP